MKYTYVHLMWPTVARRLFRGRNHVGKYYYLRGLHPRLGARAVRMGVACEVPLDHPINANHDHLFNEWICDLLGWRQ